MNIFLSYAHEDADLKDQLIRHLSVLERFHEIQAWADTEMEPGTRWREEIEQAITTADAAVLLISPYFLSSPFIQDVELPKLMDRHSKESLLLFPIIARPCPWKKHPALARLQVLPHRGRALSRMRRDNRDATLANIVDTVADLSSRRAQVRPHGA